MFDLVFIDAHKPDYPKYYHEIFPKVNHGGYIIADNILWSGKVIQKNQNDEATKNLRLFNDIIKDDHRVECSILPIRDGLTLIRKK